MEAWGKFDKSSGRVHRLEHHCADVAACFEALLRDPVLRARFVQAAGANGFCETTAARLTFLAFLHDFGKLNTGFQFKVPRPNPSSRAAPRGVGARMRAGLRASNRRARHLPMRYETGLPSSVIRFRTLHASTASRRCPDELRARRQSPTIDVYRKNAFSTRAC